MNHPDPAPSPRNTGDATYAQWAATHASVDPGTSTAVHLAAGLSLGVLLLLAVAVAFALRRHGHWTRRGRHRRLHHHRRHYSALAAVI